MNPVLTATLFQYHSEDPLQQSLACIPNSKFQVDTKNRKKTLLDETFTGKLPPKKYTHIVLFQQHFSAKVVQKVL